MHKNKPEKWQNLVKQKTDFIFPRKTRKTQVKVRKKNELREFYQEVPKSAVAQKACNNLLKPLQFKQFL